MALTQDEHAAIRAEYDRRLATITVEKHDGQHVQFAAPIGSYDYVELAALGKILRHLGYEIRPVKGDSALVIGPTKQAAEGD